jgi:carbon storage regulator CsrA
MAAMLVLTRKQSERICIGEGIELVVLAVRGDRVRIGIVCPQDVRVLRCELLPHVEEVTPPPDTVPAVHPSAIENRGIPAR